MLAPACKRSLPQTCPPTPIGAHPRASATPQGYISLGNASWPITKATEWRFFFALYYLYSARSWYISLEKQAVHRLVQLPRPQMQFFNVIVHRFNRVKDIKKLKNIWGFAH